MSSCPTCGNHDYLCQQCKMEALEARHGVPSDHFETGDDVDDDREERRFECSNCETEYETDGSDACPNCGERRRRYIGPIGHQDQEQEVATDGGTTTTSEADQVDRAVREAATLIDAGDSTTVAVEYVVAEHDLEHRRDDVHQRVRDRLEQVVLTDGGQSLNGTERDSIPPQCQLCQLLDYRGDFINEPEGMVEVARDYGGSKIVHCCERCAEELFTDPEFTPYEYCEVCDAEDDQPEIATDGGRDAFLSGDAHWCDVCSTPFETLGELIRHDCQDQQAIADGGHPQHQANCEDCPWSYRDTDLVDVSDEMERHARKEMHDVDLERAVATDGGTVSGETERLKQEQGVTTEYQVSITLERGSKHIWASRRVKYCSPAPTSEEEAIESTRQEHDDEIEEIRGVETQEVPAPEKWPADDSRRRYVNAATEKQSENSTGTEGGDSR